MVACCAARGGDLPLLHRLAASGVDLRCVRREEVEMTEKEKRI